MSLAISDAKTCLFWPDLQVEELLVHDNIELLQEAIKHNTLAIKQKDSEGRSLIQLLFVHKAFKAARYLLEKESAHIDLKQVDGKGKTLLHYACSAGDEESVAQLIGMGADADSFTVDADGYLPIHHAILSQNEEAVKVCCLYLKPALALVSEHKIPKEINTVLHLAAKSRLPILKAILDLDFPIDARDAQGRTPLHCAQESETALQNSITLLHLRADPNVVDSAGETPFSLACSMRNRQVEYLFLDETYRLDATLGGPYRLFEAFLQEKRHQPKSEPFLFEALVPKRGVKSKSDDLLLFAQCVLAGSRDLYAKERIISDEELERVRKEERLSEALANGTMVPLLPPSIFAQGKHLEKKEGCPEENSFLHELVINPECRFSVLQKHTDEAGWQLVNRRKETPFLYACRQGSFKNCLEILKCHDGLSAKDMMGNSPLHLSLLYNSVTHAFYMVALFGWRCANEKNACGQTPLHLACSRGFFHVILLLLRRGADAKSVDQEDRSALHYLCDAKNLPLVVLQSIIDALLQAGVSLEARNRPGETPLVTAWNRQNMPLVYELLKRGADPVPLSAALSGDDAVVRQALFGPKADAEVHKRLKSHEALLSTLEKIISCVEKHELCPADYRRFCALLSHGASPTSAIALAVKHNLPRIVSRLLKAGADTKEKIEGETLLDHAVKKKFSEVSRLLLEAGAKIATASSINLVLSPRRAGSFIGTIAKRSSKKDSSSFISSPRPSLTGTTTITALTDSLRKTSVQGPI